MPRAEPPAAGITRESSGSFTAERVSSVMEDLMQIQSEREQRAAQQTRKNRARSSSGDMRAPLVSQPLEQREPAPPSPPTESPDAAGSYFSIASSVTEEVKAEKCTFAIIWGEYTLLAFSTIVWMANTRSVIFAHKGALNLFGTCGVVGHADQRPFDKGWEWLHSGSLERASRISCITLAVLLFLQLVFACSRGHCALGSERVNGVMRHTNRSVKIARVLGWLGTAAAITAVQLSAFVVGAGFSCNWAMKRIFELFAAVSATSAIVLGCIEIMNHMTNYFRPKLQRHIGRVLLMVPIYALDSMLTVFWPSGTPEVLFGTIRSLWEAYTIYSFYMFVLEYLQGLAVLRVIEDEAMRAMDTEAGVVDLGSMGSGRLGSAGFPNSPGTSTGAGRSSTDDVLLGDLADGGKPVIKLITQLHAEEGKTEHIWPMQYCLAPWSGAVFLSRCKSGVLQYVAMQCLCTLVALIANHFTCKDAPSGTGTCYNEADPDPRYAYLWTQMALNFSQAWALYCLMYCYKSLKNLLSPISPLGKFMCIKMVVFATFWQQTFFTILFWTKWGKSINWCDPIACCLLEDEDGSSAYSERCDNHNQHVDVSCGFCPDKATYDSAGNKETGSDYHVLENNTMQATLICFEMLFFAVAHRRVFSWRDFVLEGDDAKPVARAFADMVDTEDVRGAVAWLVKSRVKETVSDAEMLVDESIGTVKRGVGGVLGFGRDIGGAVVDATLSIVPKSKQQKQRQQRQQQQKQQKQRAAMSAGEEGEGELSPPVPVPSDLDVSMEAGTPTPTAAAGGAGPGAGMVAPPRSPMPTRLSSGNSLAMGTTAAVHSPIHNGPEGSNRFTLDESPPKLRKGDQQPPATGPRE